MTSSPSKEFAERYTAAWSSQKASDVAAFFSPRGTLTVNGSAALGREAITATAQSFMTMFPDLEVRMDALDGNIFRWTLEGTCNGRHVRISGHEEWIMGWDGLIAESQGHFDAEEYQRQLG